MQQKREPVLLPLRRHDVREQPEEFERRRGAVRRGGGRGPVRGGEEVVPVAAVGGHVGDGGEDDAHADGVAGAEEAVGEVGGTVGALVGRVDGDQ